MLGEQTAPAVRWGVADEHPIFLDIQRRSRLAAYVPLIFSATEVQGCYDGSLSVEASWAAERAESVGLLVAERDGHLVGGAELEFCRDGEAELGSLYVLPEYQGRGVGVELWNAALAALRERGVRAMRVWTCTRATWARDFYERRGCSLSASGDITIGAHREPHVCYRIEL